MKRILLIVLAIALALSLCTGCNNVKRTVDDDFDDGPIVIGGADNGTDSDDAQTGDTQGDESDPATSPVGVEGTVIGVWSNYKDDSVAVLPASYARKFMDADMTDQAVVLTLVDEIKGDNAITDSLYVDVYRQDGTGFTFFVVEFGFGWETFKYSVEGDTFHKTDRLYNSEDDDPNWTFKDKRNDDASTEFRLTEVDGTERLFIMPNVPESSDQAGLTLEEYIKWKESLNLDTWSVRVG